MELNRNISEFKIEVCSVCQNDCLYCAHGVLRKSTKNYHLSIEQLINFIHYTEASGYNIECLNIQGSGEPLLWKHLNAGLRIFRASKNIKKIQIISNGLALDRLQDDTWECIDTLLISQYQKNQKFSVKSDLKKNTEIIVGDKSQFWPRLIDVKDSAPIPCACACSGPMLLGSRIFLQCGPPVFDAAKLIDQNIWELRDLYTDVKINYLSLFNPSLSGAMDLCRYCWANSNYLSKRQKVLLSTSGGGWQ